MGNVGKYSLHGASGCVYFIYYIYIYIIYIICCIYIYLYIYMLYISMHVYFPSQKKKRPPKKKHPTPHFFPGGSSSIVGARRATGVEGGPVGCVGLDTPTHHKQRLEKYTPLKELMAGNKPASKMGYNRGLLVFALNGIPTCFCLNGWKPENFRGLLGCPWYLVNGL